MRTLPAVEPNPLQATVDSLLPGPWPFYLGLSVALLIVVLSWTPRRPVDGALVLLAGWMAAYGTWGVLITLDAGTSPHVSGALLMLSVAGGAGLRQGLWSHGGQAGPDDDGDDDDPDDDGPPPVDWPRFERDAWLAWRSWSKPRAPA